MGRFSYKGIETADSFKFLSTDNLGDFIKLIKTYPATTNEENIELLREYQAGDKSALEPLIKGNIRAIIYKAKAFNKNNQSYQLLDLISEAVIIFIEAADTYDLEKQQASFSTYFMRGADFKLIYTLRKKDALIRKSTSLSKQILEYNRLYERYEAEGKEPPTDEEVKSILGISESRLKTIRGDYKYQASSLDATVDDDESTEYSNFVASKENISDDIVNKITNKELFIFLKRTLNDYQYYVLVMRVFGQQKYKDIAKVFALGESAVRMIEKVAHETIKKVCSEDRTSINYRLDRSISDEDIEVMRCAPIHPYDITRYMFFREVLVPEERALFKLYIKGEYIPDDDLYARLLHLDKEEYQRTKTSLFRKITNMTPELEESFNCFKEAIIKTYRSKIYNIDWDMDMESIRANANYVSKLWENKSYEEVIELLNKNGIPITKEMDKLLRQYFDQETKIPSYGDLRKAERDINNILFGLKKEKKLPIDKLLQTLEEHRDKFDDEQYQYLLMRFNKISRKEFIRQYPNTNLLDGNGFYVLSRLESLYFNIAYYKEPNFTKKKYFMVRDICIAQLSDEYIRMLDLYYGYKCKKKTVYDIQRIFKLKYEVARDKLENAKSAAMSIYLDRSSKKVIDSDYYIPYIIDEAVDLNPTHRGLLKGYLIDKKDYDTLADEFSLSNHDVSSNILDALMKIDFYRFNILRKYQYPHHIVQRAIGSPKFTVEERKILQDLVKGMSRSEVEKKHDTTIKKIDNLMTKHTNICHSLATQGYKPTIEDITRELNIHKAANVLNNNERIILAYTYGIKCDININGLTIEKKDFGQYYPNISSKYSKVLKSALDTISGKVLGIDHATMDIVDRNELKRSLLDPRIPISEKERELLYYTYELYGYKYKDLNELAALYGERSTSIKRRIWRAIATINRYENSEIQAVISYEYDVEPNLKYFSKNDRNILIAVFKDNLTYDEISKKYGLTYSQVETLVKRLDSYLRDILDGEINPFDFDYYYQVIDDEDLPFYDNLELSKEIFDLYYEQRLSYKEIKEKLDLEISTSLIQRLLSSLMLAVLKRKENIKKTNGYTYSDVIRYYRTHSDLMEKEQLESYYRYFSRVEKSREGNNPKSKDIPISPSIVLDLIKDNNENSFSFDCSSREAALEFISKNRKEISRDTLETIVGHYSLKGREYMNGSEQKKVLKTLASINIDGVNITPKMNNVPILSLTEF